MWFSFFCEFFHIYKLFSLNMILMERKRSSWLTIIAQGEEQQQKKIEL